MAFVRLAILLSVLLSVATGTLAPANAQEAETPKQSSDANGPAETIAVKGVADDASIRQRLSTIYDAAAKAGWLTEIDVVLNSGIVTLKGSADSEEHRQWAENVARKTEDVVAVVNELVVDQQLDLESTRDVVTRSLNTLWTDRGDFITCGDLTGKVKQITIRNTMIQRLDGELAVVPNATLFKNNVDVLTSQPQRRVRIICGVAYDENVEQARDVIKQALLSCDSVLGKRTVEVFAQEFASSSINFEVAWWTGSKPVDIRRSRDEVVEAIKRELDSAGIEIPFPYRTLAFKNPAVAEAVANATAQ